MQNRKLPLCSFLHSPVTSSFLDPHNLLSTSFSNTLSEVKYYSKIPMLKLDMNSENYVESTISVFLYAFEKR
jgi:hypothetical protein